MGINKFIILISAFMLRAGVILFVFSLLFEIGIGIESGYDFWNYFLQIILLIIFIGLSIILLVIGKSKFEVFGFFLVLTGSLYSIFNILFTKGIRAELSLHFLLVAVSLYFISKSRRGNRKRTVTVFD
jgi:hypothetical protein